MGWRSWKRLNARDLMNLGSLYHWLRKEGDQNGWNYGPDCDPAFQQANFDRLLRIGALSGHSLEGASCLDVGCGTGDLSQRWRDVDGGIYRGLDPLGFQLDEAQKRYPDETFLAGEFLETSQTAYPDTDFVFASGSLSVQTHMSPATYFEHMSGKMFDVAQRGVAFNLYLCGDEKTSSVIQKFDLDHVRTTCCGLAGPDRYTDDIEDRPSGQYLHGYMWR